jgi:hypothetical protein
MDISFVLVINLIPILQHPIHHKEVSEPFIHSFEKRVINTPTTLILIVDVIIYYSDDINFSNYCCQFFEDTYLLEHIVDLLRIDCSRQFFVVTLIERY